MPSGSMLKFFTDAGGPEHGGRLFWPGTADGFPVRAETPPLLHDEEYQQLATVLDYKSRMFCLWEPADKQAFDQVMDRIVNGWYMQHKRKDEWIPERQHYAVWLEWVQIYGEQPTQKVSLGG